MRFPPVGTRHSVTVQRRAWRVQKAPDLLRATDATLAVEAHLGGGRPATAVCVTAHSTTVVLTSRPTGWDIMIHRAAAPLDWD